MGVGDVGLLFLAQGTAKATVEFDPRDKIHVDYLYGLVYSNSLLVDEVSANAHQGCFEILLKQFVHDNLLQY